LQAIDGEGSQPSLALAEKVTVRPGLPGATMSAGQLTTGGTVSRTRTVKLHCALFPASSVAVQVTVVSPIGNSEPEGGAQTTVGPGSQASLALVVNVTKLPSDEAHSTVLFAGQVTLGGVVSCTVTSKEQIELLPDTSVAVQVTLVVPRPNTLPEGGEQRTTGLGSQVSVALVV